MNFKRIILFLVFSALTIAFGQKTPVAGKEKDAVIVDNVKFNIVNKSEILGSGGNVLRGEITIKALESTDEKGSKDWVRNIEVIMDAAYKPGKGTAIPLVMSAKATIFAAEVNKKTLVTFYVPWECYSLYHLNAIPDYYKITLRVNGMEIRLTPDNARTRISKELVSSRTLLESFEKSVADGASSTRGILRPLNECSTNIQYYEYNSSRQSASVIPTYLDNK